MKHPRGHLMDGAMENDEHEAGAAAQGCYGDRQGRIRGLAASRVGAQREGWIQGWAVLHCSEPIIGSGSHTGTQGEFLGP